MVCFAHLLSRVYAVSVVIPNGLTPAGVGSKMECLLSCQRNTKCSSFFFNQVNGSCYVRNNWLKQTTLTGLSPGDWDYFVIYPEHCQLPGYQFVRSVDMCLKFATEDRSWTAAKAICEADGGRMVKINSKEKMDAILEIMQSDYSFPGVWIGASDPLHDGNWVWTDGSALDFTWWAPNSLNGNRYCVQIWFEKVGWDDIYCNFNEPYICEIIY